MTAHRRIVRSVPTGSGIPHVRYVLRGPGRVSSGARVRALR